MSSCAASCCTCSPKVSCASVTSASWPIVGVPRPCHSAFSYSAQHHNHKPSKRFPPPTLAILGCAPSAAGRWSSSSDSLLPRSNSALHLSSSRLPHDTTSHLTKPLHASARAVSLCLAVLQTRFFQLLQPLFPASLALYTAQRHLALSSVLRHTTPAQLDTTPSPHSISIEPASAPTAGGSLQVAVSKARQNSVLLTSFFC